MHLAAYSMITDGGASIEIPCAFCDNILITDGLCGLAVIRSNIIWIVTLCLALINPNEVPNEDIGFTLFACKTPQTHAGFNMNNLDNSLSMLYLSYGALDVGMLNIDFPSCHKSRYTLRDLERL